SGRAPAREAELGRARPRPPRAGPQPTDGRRLAATACPRTRRPRPAPHAPPSGPGRVGNHPPPPPRPAPPSAATPHPPSPPPPPGPPPGARGPRRAGGTATGPPTRASHPLQRHRIQRIAPAGVAHAREPGAKAGGRADEQAKATRDLTVHIDREEPRERRPAQ